MSDQLGEALAVWVDEYVRAIWAGDPNLPLEALEDIVAAARNWHALTTNGPDYEAAVRVRAEQDGLDYDAFGVSRRWAWKIATQTIVDAALGLEESVTMREEAL